MSKFQAISPLTYLYFLGHPALQSLISSVIDLAKKRVLEELVKKYRGDEGERLAVLPLLEWLGDKKASNRDATVICSQKSMLTLFHQQMEQELSGDLQLPEPVDKKIAVVEKVAESVGLLLDIHAIELDVENLMVEYLGQLGSQSVTVMMSRIQNLPVPQGLNKYRRAERKRNVEMLLQILDGNSSNPNLDMFKHVKCELMSKKLNMVKKEHDIIFVKPHHKTIGQVEVKALATLQQSGEITSALNQLEGGKEEISRAHGHLLDSDWSYLGIICLPNLPQADKPTMCRNMKICNHCADYILVGDEVNTGMKSMLDSHFSAAGEFPDESVWRDQYKKIASRILAMEHLRTSVSTVQRMAGTEREVVAAFTEDGNKNIIKDESSTVGSMNNEHEQ